MSRIGRMPIAVPAGVEVNIDGNTVTVKGPKGTLTRTVNENITVALDNGVITVTRPNDQKENRSLHGLNRTLIANMVVGVSEGFKKELEIKLTKSDIAGLVSVKYGCIIKPEDVGGGEQKRRKRK